MRKVKKINSLQWVFEPLEAIPNFTQKKMFGCEAAYLGDRLVLVLADKKDPWNGVLIPTEKEYQESLIHLYPCLRPHDVLPKWLYLSQEDESFETVVDQILKLIQSQDERIGVLPKPKKLKRKKS